MIIDPTDLQALENCLAHLRKESSRLERLAKLVELDDPNLHAKLYDWNQTFISGLDELGKIITPSISVAGVNTDESGSG